MYGYKAVLEEARRGDYYEKGILPETPRIHFHQRTLNRNWKGLTRSRRGRTLLRAKRSHESVRGITVFGV